MKPSGWKYYLPEDGETADDAEDVMDCGALGFGNSHAWASFAAKRAAEQEWDNRDSLKRGVGGCPVIVVISPSGVETSFATEATEREADFMVRFYVAEVVK